MFTEVTPFDDSDSLPERTKEALAREGLEDEEEEVGLFAGQDESTTPTDVVRFKSSKSTVFGLSGDWAPSIFNRKSNDVMSKRTLLLLSTQPTGVVPAPAASRASLQPEPSYQEPRAERRRTWMFRVLVNNAFFIVLTIILTVYALVGDDFRLIFTSQPADIWFNCITIFCLIVFTVEIVCSMLGKDDYFPGFFFGLDVASTVTLVLDLTWVHDELIQRDEEDIDNLRGYRTARAAARAGRIIRSLRMVRILKLYKAYYDSRGLRQKRKDRAVAPSEDSWEDEVFDVDEEEGPQRESRVGKKLSDRTTRRVIILVLSMLIVLPFLMVDESMMLPTSASYGADIVYKAFKKFEANPHKRSGYELALLQYIYYHSWFTGRTTDSCPGSEGSTCSRDYDSHLFWAGIVSKDENTVALRSTAAQVRPQALQRWEETIATQDYIFNFGPMPAEVIRVLGSAWDTECNVPRGGVLRLGISVLQSGIDDEVGYLVECPEDLRKVERMKYAPRLMTKEQAELWHFAFYFDMRPFVRLDALYAFFTTVFICIVLWVASVFFTNDANRLVLHPVEKMIQKVMMLRSHPLMAMRMADEDFKIEERNRARKQNRKRNRLEDLRDVLLCSRMPSSNLGEPLETVILEKTIIKLGSLLAIGFGEAGANIIEHNMHGIETACVDAMIPGYKVDCIVGVARIRDFGVATEVLQAKVMTFVNQIAEIVHGVVNEFHGAANKNIGDKFLLVWRTSNQASKMADMSMLAFTRILGAAHRSAALAAYRAHPGLKLRLGPSCRVNLSFGLHFGWAIEGAVGSEFKIDASYLSPNVSITEAIERATQIYGVSLLVSEAVATTCSTEMGAKCRLIDRVIITGSVEPMELYSMDLDYMPLTVEPEHETKLVWNPRQRFRVRQFLEAEKELKLCEEVRMVSFFNESADVTAMRLRYTVEFVHVFNMGYQNYSQGEWQVAQRLLSRTRTMLHDGGIEDGPSRALLRFMEAPYNFQAPPGWIGIRQLDSTANTFRHLAEGTVIAAGVRETAF